ncbi:MAG: hypothetical protein R3338_00700 [Thermoanaerobaculia bacterium]|nr:hypothetical protein [Thermoanaerobaculia bacterium]
MPANPRENVEKGFWDGGRHGHGTARESGGRSSGFPGNRKGKRQGVKLDLDEIETTEPRTETEQSES